MSCCFGAWLLELCISHEAGWLTSNFGSYLFAALYYGQGAPNIKPDLARHWAQKALALAVKQNGEDNVEETRRLLNV